MILKQRFEDGKTAFTDIGDQWLYIQRAAPEFKDIASDYFKNEDLEKDCLGLIRYGDRKTEPVYKDFPQWVISNEGKLFMTLVSLEDKPVSALRQPTLFELQAMTHKMDYYKLDKGFIAPVYGGELSFFEHQPEFESKPITREEVLKMIAEC